MTPPHSCPLEPCNTCNTMGKAWASLGHYPSTKRFSQYHSSQHSQESLPPTPTVPFPLAHHQDHHAYTPAQQVPIGLYEGYQARTCSVASAKVDVDTPWLHGRVLVACWNPSNAPNEDPVQWLPHIAPAPRKPCIPSSSESHPLPPRSFAAGTLKERVHALARMRFHTAVRHPPNRSVTANQSQDHSHSKHEAEVGGDRHPVDRHPFNAVAKPRSNGLSAHAYTHR